MANDFSDIYKLYQRNDEGNEQSKRFDAIERLYNGAGEDTSDLSDLPEPEPIDKQADELGSRYFEGMSFDDAMAEYNRLSELPNVEKEKFSGNLVYTDTVTGRKEFIPPPTPRMLKAAGKAISKAVQAPFSDEVSLQDAADAFTNPEAKVSGVKLFEMGLRESAGDVAQFGAAVAGNDELVEAIDEATPRIDTDDSFVDSLIADGGPAVAAAVVTDKGQGLAKRGIAKAMPYVDKFVNKVTPKFLKNLTRNLSDEAMAALTVGTEEGTVAIGQDAAIPVWKGLDLEDSASNDVIEQRVNTMVEGLMGTSLLSGAGRTVADTGKLAYDILIRPLYLVVGPESAKEQIIFNDIVSKLVSDDVDLSDPAQRAEAVERIRIVVDQNSEVLLPHLDNLSKSEPVRLDTLTALLRSELSTAEKAKVGQMLAAQQTAGGSRYISRASEAKERLDDEVKSYLESLDAETPGQQTAAMQDVADEAAEQANRYLDEAELTAENAQARYEAALENIGSGISEDLEFAGRLKKLEEITGTEIVVAKDAKLDDIMQGVRDGYEDLSNQKDLLYAAIEGGPVDVDAVFDQLFDLNDDQISAAMAQVRRSSPISNMLQVINTKSIRAIDPDTGEEVVRAPTVEERRDLFRQLVEAQDADFGYFYRTIRPELSALASNLYEKGDGGAGKIVRDLVKYIDSDMVSFVEKSDPELAQAARDAKSFFQNQFAPIFGGKGVMADYADLYNSTIGRTDSGNLLAGVDVPEFDEAGYAQGLQRLTKGVFSSGIPADAEQMFRAIEVASDPDAMADYMVLDVLDRYATEVRINGLDAANLTNMSKDLQQYASQLNKLFPEKSKQITTFVRQIEQAAKDKSNLEGVLTDVSTKVKEARADIAETALYRFLDTELGNDRFLPTSNPQAAFNELFNSKESVRNVNRLNSAINALPPEKQVAVRKGLEVAYARRFNTKVSDFREEVGGNTPIKEAALAKSQQEFDQLFAIGREVFADKPEVMEALEAYADLAGFVQKGRNSKANVTSSNTAFAQEATAATNRLIFSFIGPLSRPGTRIRAASSTIVQRLAPDQVAADIKDRILADPDYFVQLARKYNAAPRDKEAEDLLTRFLVGATIKTTASTDEEDLPAGIDYTVGYAADQAADAVEGISTGIDYLDEQMNGAFPE